MYTWVACEAVTGAIIADLPDLTVPTVKTSIGQYESATASLPIPSAPANWVRATKPYASVLAFVDEDAKTVLWAGYITHRTRSAADTVELSLATAEAYLDRRYVGDETYTGVGQLAIVSDLVTKYAIHAPAMAGSSQGLPARIQVVGDDTITRDRTYADSDDKTVYSALQDLAGVINGPEWWIGWEWTTFEDVADLATQHITPVFYVGNRLGNAVPAGMSPAAVFEMPGDVIQGQLDEDWTDGNGATGVMAVSTADGDVRPQSSIHFSLDSDRPYIEYRYTPSTSITNTDTLDNHAAAKILQLGGGTTTLYLQSALSAAPQFGTEWSMGDDVGFVLGGLDRFGRDTVPAYPSGLTGTTRAIAMQIDWPGIGSEPLLTPITTLSGDNA